MKSERKVTLNIGNDENQYTKKHENLNAIVNKKYNVSANTQTNGFIIKKLYFFLWRKGIYIV